MNPDLHILIVEDEAIIAISYRVALSGALGCHIDVAMSAEEAIEKIRVNQPDIILMDIQLGEGMSGIEAADIIGKDYGIPFIYITGNTDELTKATAMRTKPVAYVEKPAEMDVVASIILSLQQNRV